MRVDEIAKSYYGQLLENSWDIPPRGRAHDLSPLVCACSVRALFPCESVASVRITDYRQSRDKARRISRTLPTVVGAIPVSQTRPSILARFSREFILFAARMRGEDARASMKSRARITDNYCQGLGHRWRGARSACRHR